MGRAQRHTPTCVDCGQTLPHYLMVCIRLANGRKIHRCIACSERRATQGAGKWSVDEKTKVP